MNKTELQKLAQDINSLLSEYISLHDTLQEKTNSLLGIFKPIDFGELYHKAEDVLIRLESKLSEIYEVKKHTGENSEKEFIACLLEYTEALITTVRMYKKMVGKLLDKSYGGKLSLKEHLKNAKEYKESIKRYSTIGKRLNNLYKNL